MIYEPGTADGESRGRGKEQVVKHLAVFSREVGICRSWPDFLTTGAHLAPGAVARAFARNDERCEVIAHV